MIRRRRDADLSQLQGKDASCRWAGPRAVRRESLRSRSVAAAAQRAGLDAAALRAGGPADAELDALYQQYTEEALAAGVFGAPSYVLPSGEIFWGQDRLELLDRALKLAA